MVDKNIVTAHFPDMSRISAALRAARLTAGIPQRKLAAQLGMTPQFLCMVEAGTKVLPHRYLGRLPDQVRPAVVAVAIAELERLALDLRPLLTVAPK